MDPSPILSVIQNIAIGTMLNFCSGNNGHELENVTCKQTLSYTHTKRQASVAALKFWRLGWRLGMGLGLILKCHNAFQWDLAAATDADAWRSVCLYL